jgi:hypothetical protein
MSATVPDLVLRSPLALACAAAVAVEEELEDFVLQSPLANACAQELAEEELVDLFLKSPLMQACAAEAPLEDLSLLGQGSSASQPPVPEINLRKMLQTLHVSIRPGRFVFVSMPSSDLSVLPFPFSAIEAMVLETEGPSFVLRYDEAARAGVLTASSSAFVASWLTLEVYSSLSAVGLTAAVASALAAEGIACNVIAGTHHDHLLVPEARREDAVGTLAQLQHLLKQSAATVGNSSGPGRSLTGGRGFL